MGSKKKVLTGEFQLAPKVTISNWKVESGISGWMRKSAAPVIPAGLDPRRRRGGRASWTGIWTTSGCWCQMPSLDRTSTNADTVVSEFGTVLDSFQEYVGSLRSKKEEFNARIRQLGSPLLIGSSAHR